MPGVGRPSPCVRPRRICPACWMNRRGREVVITSDGVPKARLVPMDREPRGRCSSGQRNLAPCPVKGGRQRRKSSAKT